MTMAQDGGKVVSLMHRLPLLPGKVPGTHFYQRLSRPQGHSATGRIMSLKNSNDTIGNLTRDLPENIKVTSKLYDVLQMLIWAEGWSSLQEPYG